ncbi:MAG TPA: carboxypeptidase-like regulatory domain-containing protein [Candidatus Ozemobacteraceae bacterium]|nr:carboxypeptidase-like regulatory domain-containing protein [Candidatus Ozemobacteraceae bacterium]
MNLRVWGGWLLAVAGVSVLMTMGCEKGALGVRSSNVRGTIIDSASSNPINGVRVRLVTETAVMGNSQQALGQNYVTQTDGNGQFMFTNMTPDKMKLEASKVGYEDLEYPGGSSTVTVFYVPNGEDVNLGALKMAAIPNPLPQNISVRIILRDSKSMEVLDPASVVSIAFDDKVFTHTVLQWQSGQTAAGDPITLPAKSGDYTVSINPDPEYYKTKTMTIPGNSAIMTDITLEANSYNLVVRCVNVPDYIKGGVVNLYAEKIDTDPERAAKVLATHTINNLGTLSSPNLPEIVTVPGIAFPIYLRVNIRGYQDEVVKIDDPAIADKEQGNIRIDVDFLADNGTTTVVLKPIIPIQSKAGLLDNRITRPVTLRVAGPDLLQGDSVEGYLWGNPTYNPLIAPLGGFIDVEFPNVPVGYELPYSVTVMPAPARAASGSYSIPNPAESKMISPPEDLPAPTLIIGVNAKRPS